MAAPKRVNTAPGAAAARRAKWARWVAELSEAGYEIVPPDSPERTEQHPYTVEYRHPGDPWLADTGDQRGSRTPRWYSPTGAYLRIQELERRGLIARRT